MGTRWAILGSASSMRGAETHALSYFLQQNKWYPQRCLLAHFEDTLDFSRSEFTCT